MASEQKKRNQLMWLGIVLGVLALAIVLLTDPFGLFKPGEAEREAKEGVSKTLCAFSQAEVAAFELKPAGGAAFKIYKDANTGKWMVETGGNKYRADMERVSKLLDQVPGLRAEGEATRSKDKYATFEIDDSKAIGLKVFTKGDQPAVSLLVGKADQSYQASFVRLEGDPVVYRASANIKSLIAFTAKDYRSRKPWEFSPAAATSVTIRPQEGGGAPLTFTRQDNLWKLPDGKNGNQNLINETLKKLSGTQINEFVDAPDDAVVKLSGVEPQLTLKAGIDEYKFTLGAVDNSQAYVKDHDGWVYKGSAYSMKFYTDLPFDQLTFDDTKKEEAKPGGPPKPGEAKPPAASGVKPAPGAKTPPAAPPPAGGKSGGAKPQPGGKAPGK
jgi:hypothetical protein